MNTSEQILVIFLSTFLALFLLIGVIVLIKTLQVINSIKRITDKAEEIANKAEAVSEFFQASAGPAALGKLVSNIIQTVRENKGKDKDKS